MVLRLSSNMIGNNETNFLHELLLINRQVASIRKAFPSNSPTNIKFSKSQFSETIQSGQFLSRLLGPLLKTGLTLTQNFIKPLAKNVLIPAASAANAGIHKKILGSGNKTLIISNDEMEYIIKIVTSHKDTGLLLLGVTKTVQNEVKKQKGWILSMLLGTLGASLLGNLLTGKEIYRTGRTGA